jgi:class 3 adenylate cyclase
VHPERTSALVTFAMFAKRMHAPDPPGGVTIERRQRLLEAIERDWGGAVRIDEIAPSVAQGERFRRWWAGYLRLSGSPGAAITMALMNREIDVRPILLAIRVPTLVLHRVGDQRAELGEAHFIASSIPDARLVELPGDDRLPWVGDAGAVLDEVEEFMTGARGRFEPDRRLATLVFTDIAGSTARAVELGDLRWRAPLVQHHALVRRELERFGGSQIDTRATGPRRVRRARARHSRGVREPGRSARAGARRSDSRVMNQAGAGEVLVPSTVKDLVVGSGIEFDDRGAYELKGVPGEWRLFAVARG